MQDDSLLKSIDAIVQSIDSLDIPIVDKVEVLLNIRQFLDPKDYRDNVETLGKKHINKKWRYYNEDKH
jgi:hypothetical protein